MISSLVPRIAVRLAALSILTIRLSAQPGQPAGTQGIPPRSSASDYIANAKAGDFTIGAEFTGHALPTAQGPLNSEDYVAVEVAIFGPEGAKLKLSIEDFTLRINGKKQPSAAQSHILTYASLKDPEYEAPEPAAQKSKGGIKSGGGGGGGEQGAPPPSPPPIPIEVRRAMQQRIQKAALPAGERAMPQAGLVFYQHRGKVSSAELIYNGPAGQCALKIAP